MRTTNSLIAIAGFTLNWTDTRKVSFDLQRTTKLEGSNV